MEQSHSFLLYYSADVRGCHCINLLLLVMCHFSPPNTHYEIKSEKYCQRNLHVFGSNEFPEFWTQRCQERAGLEAAPATRGCGSGTRRGRQPTSHHSLSCTAGRAGARSSSAPFVPRPRWDVPGAESKHLHLLCTSLCCAAGDPAGSSTDRERSFSTMSLGRRMFGTSGQGCRGQQSSAARGAL